MDTSVEILSLARTAKISSSDMPARAKGFRFFLIEQCGNRKGAWGMVRRRSRSAWRGIMASGIPSIAIVPLVWGTRFSSEESMVDFPEPEGPMKAVFEAALTSNERSEIVGRSFQEAVKLEKVMWP